MNQQVRRSGLAVPGADDMESRAERERTAIIRAAHRLIGHGAGGATPIEDILRSAGVNRRTFYRHFPSKDALLLTMQHEAGGLVSEALWSVTGRAADGRAAVLAWIEEFLSIGWDSRRLREGRTFLAPEVGLVRGRPAPRSHRPDNAHCRAGAGCLRDPRRRPAPSGDARPGTA
jgi:AcrR family transcriptional regulator